MAKYTQRRHIVQTENSNRAKNLNSYYKIPISERESEWRGRKVKTGERRGTEESKRIINIEC